MRCQLGQFDLLAFTCYCWHYAYAASNQMQHIIPKREKERDSELWSSFSLPLPFYLALPLSKLYSLLCFPCNIFRAFFAAFPFGFLHKICQTGKQQRQKEEEKVHGERAKKKKVIAIERRLPLLLLLLLLPVWIFLLVALTF